MQAPLERSVEEEFCSLFQGGMGEKWSELWAWNLHMRVRGLGCPTYLLRRTAFCTFFRSEDQNMDYTLEVLKVNTVCHIPLMKEMLKLFQGEQNLYELELPRSL